MSRSRRDRDREPRSNPEIEVRLLEAHARGASIDDLEYEEVTGLLDVVLARTKAAAASASAELHVAAKKLAERPTGGGQGGLRRVGT